MHPWTDIFAVFLEKRNFEKTTSNIDILSIIGNGCSPWLIIWGRYLKIKPFLAWIHSQSFDNPSWKACFEFRPLLSWTKDTIMIVGSNGTSWRQEPPSKVAEDSGSMEEPWPDSHAPPRQPHWESEATELGPRLSAPSELLGAARVTAWSSECLDQRWPKERER